MGCVAQNQNTFAADPLPHCLQNVEKGPRASPRLNVEEHRAILQVVTEEEKRSLKLSTGWYRQACLSICNRSTWEAEPAGSQVLGQPAITVSDLTKDLSPREDLCLLSLATILLD